MTALYIVAAYLVAASVLALIPATLAKNKGRSFAAWWGVSVLALGIFTVIPVGLLPTYRCPACREVVRPNASVCWRCGHDLTRIRSAAQPTVITREQAEAEMSVAVTLMGISVVLLAPIIWAAFVGLATAGAIGLTAGLVVFVAGIDMAVLLSARRSMKLVGFTS